MFDQERFLANPVEASMAAKKKVDAADADKAIADWAHGNWIGKAIVLLGGPEQTVAVRHASIDMMCITTE
jgi:hypothetical protein